MSPAFITTAYIAAALFFVLGLAGLSKQETAKQGNYFGIAGMALALVTTLLSCLLYTSPSPRDRTRSRMPSSA